MLRHGASTTLKDGIGKVPMDLCTLEPGNACMELLTNEADPNQIDIDWNAPVCCMLNCCDTCSIYICSDDAKYTVNFRTCSSRAAARAGATKT